MAIITVDDNFMVCPDCAMFIANDDLTALSLLDEEEAERIEGAIRTGVAKQSAQGNHIYIGNGSKDVEFSIKPCECCGNSDAGYRHHAILLTNGEQGEY